MGGENTQTIQKPQPPGGKVTIQGGGPAPEAPSPAPPAPDFAAGPGQELEVHYNNANGELHFHDRRSGLKAAVPIAEWVVGYRRLRQLERYECVDLANGTLLRVFPDWTDGRFELQVVLVKVAVGPTMTALSKYGV